MCWLITVKGGTCEPPGLIAARLSIVNMISTIDIAVIVLIAPARQNAGSSRTIYLSSRPRVAKHQRRLWRAGSALHHQVFNQRLAIFGILEAGKDHFCTGHELSRIREIGIERPCVPNVAVVLIGGGIREAGECCPPCDRRRG